MKSSSKVESIELTKDGLTISRVLTGLWQIADMERTSDDKLDPSVLAQFVHPYLEAGFTTFDMADHYGCAEEIVGASLQTTSRRIQCLTKWVPTPGPVSREQTREAIERSLNRLQTDCLDLLQFHCWTYSDPIWLDCLGWLQELQQEGKIRHLGLTNVDTAHLQMALDTGFEIVTNQISYSLLDQRAASGKMTELCLERGIKILAFGTLAGGFLTDRWLGTPEPDKLETWSQMKYFRYIREAGGWKVFQELLTAMDGVAKKHRVSIANVAMRHVLEQPAVAGVIVGARLGVSEHIEDNLALFGFKLDEEDHLVLQQALAKLSPLPGDCGDEYRKPPYLTASGDLSHHVDKFPSPFPTETFKDGTVRVRTGTTWESFTGYCRAVKRGNDIAVAGTTAAHGAMIVGGSNPASQTHFVLDKIDGALKSLGSSGLEDVIRTRIFVKEMNGWETVARAHGERFKHILPACTLVQANLVGDKYLVEIEADAKLSG